MNGVSVYPVQKTQNAPTWQVENQGRGGCFFVIFGLFSTHPTQQRLGLQRLHLFKKNY